MSQAIRARRFSVVLLGLLWTSGCGGSDEQLSTVSGKVTLDGSPLKGARVEFDAEKGSAAYGVTDADGNYELEYRHDVKGAPLGKYTVRITTRRFLTDAQGNETEQPEILPPKYTQKGLNVEVKPGHNTHDFQLTLKPSSNTEG
ncbi:MAG: carboxypeptidase-like regulatory domain-containing protein [Planctomycetota bacterium]|jgi:hypothetical protein